MCSGKQLFIAKNNIMLEVGQSTYNTALEDIERLGFVNMPEATRRDVTKGIQHFYRKENLLVSFINPNNYVNKVISISYSY